MPFDPLRRPDDWVEPSKHTAHPSYSNAPRYLSEDGLEHWWDVKNNIIRTSDPTVSLSFHSLYSHGYAGHSYAKLNFDGNFATITKDWEPKTSVAFSPDYSERTESGAQIWYVDHLFRTLHLPDSERYPWVSLPSILPKVTVRGMSGFLNLEQQDRFIQLITTLLSRHDASPLAARRGKKARGKVIFGDKLQHAFGTGQLIL